MCAELGFTLENVEGVKDIKPKALGMRGQEVDFDILEIGDRPSELKIKDEKKAKQMENATRGNRVDLGKVADESQTRVVASEGGVPGGLEGDFVSLEFGGGAVDGQEFEALNYNHKLRRKLHRAIEAAQIQKELLVRAKAKEHCETNGIELPAELAADYKPIKLAGRRILEDGTLETEKQERVRKRLELAEYNKAAKVLRQQAKAEAIEAGLRVFAELTGKKPNDMQAGSEAPLDGAVLSPEVKIEETAPEPQSSKKRRRDGDDTEKKETKKAKKSASLSQDHTAAVDAIGEVKEASKHKREKRKISERDEQSQPNGGLVDNGVVRKEKKKDKRDKAARLDTGDGDLNGNENLEPAAQKLKKSKRRKSEESAVVPLPEKDEKPKKHRNKKGESSKEEAGELNGGEQWNADALTGDAARKDKFLRLLGASKVTGTDKPSKKVKAKPEDLVRMENDLERQFEAGIKMKHDAQGKRRGLGA